MARFRSGTLGRSVRRWGRLPGMKAPFKRIQHGWKYVDLEESSLDETGVTTADIVLADADDWVLVGTGTGVRNMVLELDIAIVWTPTIDETPATFNSWRLKAGIWCLDADDTGGGIDAAFGDQRAIWWRTFANNNDAAATANGQEYPRRVQWRARAKQRWLQLDQELRFKCKFDSDVGSVISDARLFIFGRVSWEIP